MAYRARACRTPEEYMEALRPIGHYFGWVPPRDDFDRFSRYLPLDRLHAVFEGAQPVAGAGAYTFDMTVPGARAVPCAGVTVVGTFPTHRRRGLLRRLMRAQLDDVHARGEPLAALFASEETIYGRYGYGLASLRHEMRLARASSALRAGTPPRAGAVRLVEADEALRVLPTLYRRVQRATPGFMSRSRDWWELRRLRDSPESRPAGSGPLNLAVLELDGRPDAYALYRIVQREMEDGRSVGHVQVPEALGTDVVGTREIWRFLLEIDWMEEIRTRTLGVDHPILHLVARPDSLKLRTITGLWVRLVDVGGALSARRYARDGRVTFEVSDEFCSWNAGTWTLEGGEAGRSRRRPDLRLDVTGLGATYLGGFSFAQLARAGLVEEVSRNASARADALFATDRAPWCPEIF